MKRSFKGGVETIIATVILAGIVIALIIGVVIPMGQETQNTASIAIDKTHELQTTIGPSDKSE